MRLSATVVTVGFTICLLLCTAVSVRIVRVRPS